MLEVFISAKVKKKGFDSTGFCSSRADDANPSRFRTGRKWKSTLKRCKVCMHSHTHCLFNPLGRTSGLGLQQLMMTQTLNTLAEDDCSFYFNGTCDSVRNFKIHITVGNDRSGSLLFTMDNIAYYNFQTV